MLNLRSILFPELHKQGQRLDRAIEAAEAPASPLPCCPVLKQQAWVTAILWPLHLTSKLVPAGASSFLPSGPCSVIVPLCTVLTFRAVQRFLQPTHTRPGTKHVCFIQTDKRRKGGPYYTCRNTDTDPPSCQMCIINKSISTCTSS